MQLRIRQDQRGISSVIVVMLSLVILVIISANVILWSYQMNQLDWEKMQEDVSIVDVRDTWSYNPSGYGLGGSTSLVSGSVSNLTSDDDVYMTFRSYTSATVPSTKNLTAHSETATMGESTYYLLKDVAADGVARTLTIDSATTGRKLWGKFVYNLSGVDSIPAANWTFHYRVMRNASEPGAKLPTAHADVNATIRKSDGTVRDVIATNVANSPDFAAASLSWETVSASYSLESYTVVNQTDYLEVNFYCEVTAKGTKSECNIMIDNNTLALADQMRIANVIFSLISECAMEVEFTGSSNAYNWTELVWTVDGAWTAGLVDVTLQLYNYTLDGYSTSGNGYMAYTSNGTPNTDETKSQTISVNPTRFRNATGCWRMRVRGVKATDTQFDFKADWIEFKVVSDGGTFFTFENRGSLTSHLVSLWVTNSMHHRRYDMDVILNSGETLPYPRVDISLPSGQYLVKVVTERGNIATFSGE